MTSLRIAVWHNLPTGGGKRALHMHVKGLHARGHRLRIYSTTAAAHHYLPLAPYAESEALLPLPPAPPLHRSLASRLIPTGFRSEPAEARIAMVQQMKLLCQQSAAIIERDGCDVLFANSSMDTYVSPLGSYIDRPSMIYLGEPNRAFYEALPRLPWLLPLAATKHPRNILKRAMERSRDLHQNQAYRYQATEELNWARSYDRILSNSKFSRESILRAYCLESSVCYLGIDSDDFRPSNKPKSNYVVGAGSINFTKRIDAAIMAVATIPAAIRPKFLWIGNFSDDGYRSHICQLAHEVQVDFENRILVSDQELQAAMAEAACFLYTSHLEPFGLTPLEANACGTAVVAIAEGGVRETIIPGINGWLAADNNSKELAELIMQFTTNLNHAEEVGAQAREHVIKNWSTTCAIDRIEQHLLSIAR
jgi:glycosyltransferase involved in cell wall biosynthesis